MEQDSRIKEKENSKFIKEYEDIPDFGKQSKYVLTILKKFNIEPIELLGEGSYGKAWLTKDNKVLKITKDRTETYSSNLIVNKKLSNVVNIYKVFKLKSIKNHYFILQEKLKKMTAKDENLLDWTTLVSLLPKNKFEKFYSKQFVNFVERYNDEIDMFKNALLSDLFISVSYYNKINHPIFIEILDMLKQTKVSKMVTDIINGVNQLKKNKVNFSDIHAGNIMMKNNDYTIIDLGVSQSPKTEIDILESLIIKKLI